MFMPMPPIKIQYDMSFLAFPFPYLYNPSSIRNLAPIIFNVFE